MPFEVTQHNFFVAYAAVTQQACRTGIHVVDVVQNVAVPGNDVSFWDLLPQSCGGRNPKRLETEEFLRLQDMARRVASEEIVRISLQCVKEGHVVFVVANTQSHAEEINKAFNKQVRVRVMAAAKDVHFRPDEKFDVLVVPLHNNAGYTATMCDVQITGLYCSNAASRAQIRGRINRLGSPHKDITYFQVIAGPIQELIAAAYDRHDSFLTVLQDLS